MVNQHLDFTSLLKRCVWLKLPDFSVMKMDIQTKISTFEFQFCASQIIG